MCKLILASLLSFDEQASLVELARRGGLSDQKIKKGTFVRFENKAFESQPSKFVKKLGIPNQWPYSNSTYLVICNGLSLTNAKILNSNFHFLPYAFSKMEKEVHLELIFYKRLDKLFEPYK